MLDAFCRFLIDGVAQPETGAARIALDDYHQSRTGQADQQAMRESIVAARSAA